MKLTNALLLLIMLNLLANNLLQLCILIRIKKRGKKNETDIRKRL